MCDAARSSGFWLLEICFGSQDCCNASFCTNLRICTNLEGGWKRQHYSLYYCGGTWKHQHFFVSSISVFRHPFHSTDIQQQRTIHTLESSEPPILGILGIQILQKSASRLKAVGIQAGVCIRFCMSWPCSLAYRQKCSNTIHCKVLAATQLALCSEFLSHELACSLLTCVSLQQSCTNNAQCKDRTAGALALFDSVRRTLQISAEDRSLKRSINGDQKIQQRCIRIRKPGAS